MNEMTGTRQYHLTDTIIGWGVMIASFIVYLLTMEPAVSYWDCPEYVLTAYRLEIGHPPGNPMFSLAGRFFITLLSPFTTPAQAINIMSALFSSLTVLMLYWSVSLIVREVLAGENHEPTRRQWLTAIASGICASLTFAFSDSFWFSAVEAEVYAFSSFCTALTIWIMLRWAATPAVKRRDAYIVLTAYLTGLSLGVHELNLLSIPVFALIILYALRKRVSFRLFASILLLSLLVLAMILFGMVPGMLELAGKMEILFVNCLNLPFNSGVAAYGFLLILLYIGGIFTANGKSPAIQRIFLLLCMIFGGFLFFGRNVAALAVCSLLFALLLFFLPRIFTRRVCTLILWCAFGLSAGFSVYLVIPIRAAANPPVNTGTPSDIFSFDSYFSREQYGSKPLLYGRTPYSQRMKAERFDSLTGTYDYSRSWYSGGSMRYAKSDSNYIELGRKREYRYTPELDMVFPRLTSGRPGDIDCYADWAGMTRERMKRVSTTEAIDSNGRAVAKVNPVDGKRHHGSALKPTQLQNLTYFAGYQVGYMYLRYLMWNFAGRQNDLHSQGQVDLGNFITGFSSIDEAMTGDPVTPENTRRQADGRHTYYLLPFIFGIAGIVWLSTTGRCGRRASMTVAVLFVMTGLAIVVYLNQTPCEPRERDYAYVGSFYAFAMWVGCAVPLIISLLSKIKPLRRYAPVIGLISGLIPPLLLIIDNYPDHDRSERTLTPDFARFFLESTEPDAIMFVNGDNYTFPLWYAQEVDGVRRDIRIVNMAYLATPWYAAQLLIAGEGSEALPLHITRNDILSNRYAVNIIPSDGDTLAATYALRSLYASKSGTPSFPSRYVTLDIAGKTLTIDLREMAEGKGYMELQKLIILDILASDAESGMKRPVYFMPNLPAHVTAPIKSRMVAGPMLLKVARDTLIHNISDIDTDDSYRFFTSRTSWGGMEKEGLYADGPGTEQVSLIRRSMLRTARLLMSEGDTARADRLLRISLQKLNRKNVPFRLTNPPTGTFNEAVETASLALDIARYSGNPALRNLGMDILREEIIFAADNLVYRHNLPQRLRGTVSPASIQRGQDLPRALLIYRQNGGDASQILGQRKISTTETDKLIRNFLRREALARMLRSEFPAETDVRIYFENGGDSTSLAKYPQIKINQK